MCSIREHNAIAYAMQVGYIKEERVFEKNPCEFQENRTVLNSHTCPLTLFSFLHALRARIFFGALRPIPLSTMTQNRPTVKTSARSDHYKCLVQRISNVYLNRRTGTPT